MLKVIDDCHYYNQKYYGLLDTETNTLTYVTLFDLQKYCRETDIEIGGVTYKRFNSSQKQVLVNHEDSLRIRGKKFSWVNNKIIDYEKVKGYKIGYLPPDYLVYKDAMIFRFKQSQKMGNCWHAELYSPMLKEHYKIKLPKELLGFPITDISGFFQSTLMYKTEKSRIGVFEYCNNIVSTLDFSSCDFSFIQDVTELFHGLYSSVTLRNLNFSSMHYCDCFLNSSRCNSYLDEQGFQVLDLTFTTNPDFILSDDSLVFNVEGVLLVLVNKDSWLASYLQKSPSIYLGVCTEQTKKQMIDKVISQRTKHLLMNKPFERIVYYALKEA